MDAQRICNILDEHAKPIAQGHCLELEVIGLPIDEFAARFSQAFGEGVGAAHGGCRFRSLRCYADNASRHWGVDLAVGYFRSLLTPELSRAAKRRQLE